MLQVPFFICRYLLLNIQVPFSTRQQAIHGTVLFTPDLLTPHTAITSLPATVPVVWNVSTHFFYPCAHSVVASSTRCHLNRRKLNTYRDTRRPSWENGTWQVPSQLSHSAWGPEMDHRPLGRSYLVGVPSYDMSCALILLTGLYGWDSMVDININPSSMGPIFGVLIGQTIGVPKWTIRHWAAAIW